MIVWRGGSRLSLTPDRFDGVELKSSVMSGHSHRPDFRERWRLDILLMFSSLAQATRLPVHAVVGFSRSPDQGVRTVLLLDTRSIARIRIEGG